MIYLASPGNQLQAQALINSGNPALLSFALYSKWMDDYHPGFRRVLIDSGAYSVMNTGKEVDLPRYVDWSEAWRDRADAIAGLDHIRGDWRQSMKNYEACPWHFPTFHDSDPPELLDELIAMAQERNCWIGIGLVPPRTGKETFIRETLERIPDGIHVHGWALRLYSWHGRLDSMDSTNWFQDAMRYSRDFPWLTYAETLEIVCKRYQREKRRIQLTEEPQTRMAL